MQTFEKIKIVNEVVENFVDENISTIQGSITMSEIEHVINIGTSIMCNKWGIKYDGGGFVDAVLENNLSKAVGRADNTNAKALKLYCQMMYNLSTPKELI